jgi:hypothetical protein
MSAPLIDQAIQFLVERGWPMLPSAGTQKKPCVGWKPFQKQLPTVEELRAWDREFRPERWGVVTGALAEVVVADFDGEQGCELMQKWDIKPHLRTGSGGFHCYVQHPGWRVPTLNAKSGKASWPWPGLDIRGDGGFAILLGRNSNGSYVQLRDLVPEPFEMLPEEVRSFLRSHNEQADSPLDRGRTPALSIADGNRPDLEQIIRKALDMVTSSGRNNSGFWLACQLRDDGYSMQEAESAMYAYRSRVPSTNAKGQREAYTAGEAAASLQEAFSKPAREPWERHKSRRQEGVLAATSPDPMPANEDLPKEGQASGPGDVADDRPYISIYVDHTGEPLVDHTGEPLLANKYSRVPTEVSQDRRLKHRDIRVYGALAASCWQGNVASVGKRRLANLAQCAPRLVIDSLARLVAAGHIAKTPDRLRGQRARYVLLSPVFGQKQRAGVEEIAIGPGGRRRLVSVRKDLGSASTLGPRLVPDSIRLSGSDRPKQG